MTVEAHVLREFLVYFVRMTRGELLARRFAAFLILAAPLAAQKADTAVKVTFSGFVDVYYGWDFGRPPGIDRSFAGGTPFTTQPARHNEFNVNLAFIDARVDGARVRGRLALQAGTSVQSNYAGEPAIGAVSGPTLSRNIQEAFAGTRLGDNVWLDAGVFFSHMGMEGWISRDNPTYTRSLVAEYSPYYSSGARAVWQATPRVTAHLHVVNGWQNISESNSGKGVGVRFDVTAGPNATVSYYNFFTDEAGNLLRTFNGVGVRWIRGDVTFLGEGDVGTQDGAAGAAGRTWYGLLAVVRRQVSATVAIAARIERFDDKNQVIVATGVPAAPFRANGGSLGLDVTPAPRVMWRTEIRGFGANAPLFPNGTGAPKRSNLLAVSSLALTF